IAVKGSVQRLLAANGKLFAVTLDGSIHAFGKKAETAFILKEAVTALPKTPEQLIKLMAVTEVLKEAAAYDGYGLYFGHDESIIDAMVKLTKLRLDVVSADKKKVDELRLRYDRAGLYGNRIVIHHGSIASFQAPAYMANFTIVDKLQIKDLPQLYKSVRPYGGSIWMTSPTLRIAEIKAIKLSKAEVRVVPDGLLITRKGALDGAADWTHQYGNIANTVKSDDKLVKLPLGVLWFGGSSNLDVLPRHGHGPPEQVLGGYLVIEGHNKLSVRDVYTGRVVWMKTFKKMGMKGIFWDKTYKDTPLSPAYNQVHIPGANVRGSNYVVTAEGIYLVLGTNCVLLDLRTGKTLKTISMPKAGDKDVSWGYLGIYKDLLIGGYGFADYSKSRGEDKSKFGTYRRTTEYGASKGIVVFNRHSGKELWRATAKHSFIHNGLIAGNDFIYCLDKLPRSIVYILKSKKKVDPATFRIVAYNAKTGKVIWQENKDVFGTWLSYSKKHGVLVQAGASGSDRGRYEVNKGVIAYNAKDGKVLWHNPDRKYTGPLVLHNDFLLTTSNSYQISAGAFHILTGKPYTITNPVTGAKEAMIFRRNHGCNTAIASEYLLTFRSGAAGFYDLEGNSGVGNFGGFKSGCTSNLVAANGVLNA
ncbi:MAG: PQQ-binding-like beta-propeller repeat protein, partial [Lentisphaeria bacterium]|nr:PQQ-binding-like beta-propeller repeat protein [Lentisphaeria bacterium]